MSLTLSITAQEGDSLQKIQETYYPQSKTTSHWNSLCRFVNHWRAGYSSLPSTNKKMVAIANVALLFGWTNSLIGTKTMGEEQINSLQDGSPLGADFFHPFGEWPGQLGSYFVIASSLNYWLERKGAYALANQTIADLVKKHGDSIKTVKEYTELVSWVEIELDGLNRKSLYKRSKAEFQIDLYQIIKPIASRVNQIFHRETVSLKEKEVMAKISITPAIIDLKEALFKRVTVAKASIEELHDMSQPWMRTSQVIYGYITGPFILLCGIGILAGAGTGFYEAIVRDTHAALGHTGEWSIAAASAALFYKEINEIFFKNLGRFYRQKKIYQKELKKFSNPNRLQSPPTLTQADLVQTFHRFCQEELKELAQGCLVHKDAREIILHEGFYREADQKKEKEKLQENQVNQVISSLLRD